MLPKLMLLGSLGLMMALAAADMAYSQQEGFVPPARQSYVSDYAQVLNDSDERELSQFLELVHKEMNVEIYVLTIVTANPLSINEYSARVSEAWNLGETDPQRKTLLFLLAAGEGRFRLDTNVGLEEIVTNEQQQRIVDTVITPAFQRQEYMRGIVAGINQFLQIVAQGEGTRIPEASNSASRTFLPDVVGILLIVALVALVLVAVTLLR
jgi:uncharacterized protein